MHPTYSQFMPFVLAAVVVWSVYRRLRRSFGKQRLRPIWMGIRIGIFLLLGCYLVVAVARSPAYLTALAIGISVGVGLALWGAFQTRYVREQGQLYFVPHTYTGLAVSLLFLGRLVYRLLQTGPSAAAMVSSPMTFGIFYILVGYYVCYYSVVIWKSKQVIAENMAAAQLPPVLQ